MNDLRHLRTLEEVFRHAMSQTPSWIPADVVVQDEYTRDVIFRTGDDEWVVVDATRLGTVNGTSVWPHQPTPAELLRARLAAGWSPTPTALREGDRILGYAACLAQERRWDPVRTRTFYERGDRLEQRDR